MRFLLFILILILNCKPSLKRSPLEYFVLPRNNVNATGSSIPTATPLSTSKDITAYSIPSLGITGIINGTQISLASDTLTSFSPLVARFTTTGKTVTVAGINQVSDVTSNSYSSNLTYVVTAEDGSTKNYTVTLTAPRTYGGGSLVIWLKADSLALSDGALVSTWPDMSGYGNHFTQATASKQPTYRTNQVNGLPALQFRQATIQNMVISSGGVNLYIDDNASFFFVFKLIQTNAAGTTILNINGSNGREMALTDPSGQYLQCRNGVSCSQTSGAVIDRSSFVAIGSIQIQGATVNEIWNGDLKGVIAATGGNFNYVGGASPGTSYLPNGNLDADFAEVLFFNTALSQTEIDKIFCYLRAKYNLISTNTSCGI